MAVTSELAGQLALVTGASRGIGRATAIQLAQRGAHIIALARTSGALEELDDEIKALGQPDGATLVPLDLADHDALDRLGRSIYDRWGKLDMLVGNAGILGPITPVSHITPKNWDALLAVNVTANWRLIRSLEPLLKQAKPGGRAIFVSSSAAIKTKPYWGGYSMSKAALESIVRVWAAEKNMTTLRINLFNPGGTRTEMRAAAMPGEDPAQLPTPEQVAAFMIPYLLPDCAISGELITYKA